MGTESTQARTDVAEAMAKALFSDFGSPAPDPQDADIDPADAGQGDAADAE